MTRNEKRMHKTDVIFRIKLNKKEENAKIR